MSESGAIRRQALAEAAQIAPDSTPQDARIAALEECLRSAKELLSEHYDPDAILGDPSPKDMFGHVHGLIIKDIEKLGL